MAYQGDKTTGFQSPAQDFVEPVLDLASRLNLQRAGIYPVRVLGQALAERGIHVPGRDGINVWVPVADQGAALLHLAAAGVRAASGDPFWIKAPDAAHIRITTSSVDHQPSGPHLDEIADLVADASRAGTWSGHR